MFRLFGIKRQKEDEPMKYLIVGLGNIGDEYAGTRHNIGFDVVDAIAENLGATFSPARYGDVAEARVKGRTLILLKPSTYVNLSGKAVNYWMQKEKIDADHIFVIVDDLAIPFGSVRIRKKGNDGGHNGLKSINALIGTNNYARLRVGIGSHFNRGGQVDYVLGKWTEEEAAVMPELLKHCTGAVKSLPCIGIDRVMNEFNKKTVYGDGCKDRQVAVGGKDI